MGKPNFDILLYVALEEEYLALRNTFPVQKELLSDPILLVDVSPPGQDLRIAAAHAFEMGEAAAAEAIRIAATHAEISALICTGICGALSDDLHLADVCVSTQVTTTENSKVSPGAGAGYRLELSGRAYDVKASLLNPFRTFSLSEASKESFASWLESATARTSSLRDGSIRIAHGKFVSTNTVVASSDFKKEIKVGDRKFLAVDMESGGVFRAAASLEIPAIVVRGVSDLSDEDKSELEKHHKGAVRDAACVNAFSLIKSITCTDAFLRSVWSRRNPQSTVGVATGATIETAVETAAQEIVQNLAALTPVGAQRGKHWVRPLPGLRPREAGKVVDAEGLDGIYLTDPISAALANRIVAIRVKPGMNDPSTPWVIADRLSKEAVDGRPVVPIVVPFESIKTAKGSIHTQIARNGVSLLEVEPPVQPILIVENARLKPLYRLKALLNQIKEDPKLDALRCIILISDQDHQEVTPSLIIASGVAEYWQADYSLSEIATFVEGNYDLDRDDAQRFALQLNETFAEMRMPLNPMLLSSLPREMVARVIGLQRRLDLCSSFVDSMLAAGLIESQSDIITAETYKALLTQLASERMRDQAVDTVRFMQLCKDFASRKGLPVQPRALLNDLISSNLVVDHNNEVLFAFQFLNDYFAALAAAGDADLARRFFVDEFHPVKANALWLFVESGRGADVADAIEAKVKEMSEGDASEALISKVEAYPSIGYLSAESNQASSGASVVRELAKRKVDLNERQKTMDLMTYAVQHSFERHADQLATKALDSEVKADVVQPGVSSEPESETTPDSEVAINSEGDGDVRPLFEGGMGLALATCIGAGAECLDAAPKERYVRSLVQTGVRIAAAECIERYGHGFDAHYDKTVGMVEKSPLFAELEEASREALQEALDSYKKAGRPIFYVEPLVILQTVVSSTARSPLLRETTKAVGSSASHLLERVVCAFWLLSQSFPDGIAALSKCARDLENNEFVREWLLLALHFAVREPAWTEDQKLELAEVYERALPRGLKSRKMKMKGQAAIGKLDTKAVLRNLKES